jgi:hypothetical protein
VAVDLVDLGDDVSLAFNEVAHVLVEIRAVELARIGQCSGGNAGVPVVVHADDDVAARWPVRHGDGVLDELDSVFGLLEVEGGFEVEVGFFGGCEQLA